MFTRWNPVAKTLDPKDPIAVALGRLRWFGVRYEDRQLHAKAMAAKRWRPLDAAARRAATEPARKALAAKRRHMTR